MKLNLGCGSLLLEGWVNCDIFPGPGVDVVHDLDVTPWPWPDTCAGEILAHDIYEHLDRPLHFMAECWRVLRPGGLLSVKTTYYQGKSGYTDPTHKRWLTEQSFDYWIPGTPYFRRYPAYRLGTGAQFTATSIEVSGDLLVAELVKA